MLPSLNCQREKIRIIFLTKIVMILRKMMKIRKDSAKMLIYLRNIKCGFVTIRIYLLRILIFTFKTSKTDEFQEKDFFNQNK